MAHTKTIVRIQQFCSVLHLVHHHRVQSGRIMGLNNYLQLRLHPLRLRESPFGLCGFYIHVIPNLDL